MPPPIATLHPNGTTILTLRSNTVLVCRLDKPINSKTARIGDRIEAWVVESVTDNRGTLLVPRNSKVIGRVEQVHRARNNRPAMVEVGFDTLQRCRVETRGGSTRDQCDPRTADIVQMSGVLVPLTEENCKAINEDGTLEGRRGGAKRTFAFVASGAGGGAIVGGLITGAALGAGVGAGIGAGVGALISLVSNGKDVKIAAGTKFGVELTRPLPLTSQIQRTSFERPPIKRPPSSNTLISGNPPSGGPGPSANDRLVPVREIYARQLDKNEIEIRAIGVVPNPTWDLYLETVGVINGVLNLNLRAYPTQSWAARQPGKVSRETTLNTPDVYHRIKRVVVHGADATRSQAYIHPLGSNGIGVAQPPPPPADQTVQVGKRLAQKLATLAQQYESDGSALTRLRSSIGNRRILVDALNRAAEAAQPLREPLAPEAKRVALSKLLFRVEAVNRVIPEVTDFNSGYRASWQAIQNDIDIITQNTPGVVRP